MLQLKIIYIFIVALLLSTSVIAGSELMTPVSGSPKAKSFSLDSVNGETIDLDDYKGKFVLLNFWATWCAPCRKEMPAMNNLHKQLNGRGFEVVGVHVGPSLAGVKKFLKAVPVSFTILLDKDMSLASWGVRGLPTTYLINPEGKLVYKATGEREWDSSGMIEFLNGLLTSYERMASNKTEQVEKKKSFFASLKESFGWGNNDEQIDNQLIPN